MSKAIGSGCEPVCRAVQFDKGQLIIPAFDRNLVRILRDYSLKTGNQIFVREVGERRAPIILP